MATWTRQKQERDNQSYFFSGTFYVTEGVREILSPKEILMIYQDVRVFATEQDGIDYLQVYVNERGQKLFFIDQLDFAMIASGEYAPEDNICTLLLPSEY